MGLESLALAASKTCTDAINVAVVGVARFLPMLAKWVPFSTRRRHREGLVRWKLKVGKFSHGVRFSFSCCGESGMGCCAELVQIEGQAGGYWCLGSSRVRQCTVRTASSSWKKGESGAAEVQNG